MLSCVVIASCANAAPGVQHATDSDMLAVKSPRLNVVDLAGTLLVQWLLPKCF